MARKGHKKSRAGCAECKRRHVKCDELRPICSKCTLSARRCVYGVQTRLSTFSPLQERPEYEQLSTPNASESTLVSGSSQRQGNQRSAVSSPSDETRPTTDTIFAHLELFYNFEHHTCNTVARTEVEIGQYRRLIIDRAFLRPFLMNAILALSALQLALERPERAPTYKHRAVLLQAIALEEFDSNCLQNVNESNVLDLLLFQHITALYVFCDLFNSFDDDFSEFLDHVVGCIRLLRGMNTVVQDWWDFLSNTELGGLMSTSNEHQESQHQTLDECNALSLIIQEADLSTRSIEICQNSISQLQAYFDAENHLGEEPIKSTNMLFAWLITASPEYTDLLDQRKPEALLILAYYTVLLHRRRRSWVVADAGRKLLKQIKRYLGKKWEQQLAWPDRSTSAGDHS